MIQLINICKESGAIGWMGRTFGKWGDELLNTARNATSVTPGGAVKGGKNFGVDDFADEATDLAVRNPQNRSTALATTPDASNAGSSFFEGMSSFSDLPLRAQQGIAGGGLLGGGMLAGYGMAGEGGNNQEINQPRYRI